MQYGLIRIALAVIASASLSGHAPAAEAAPLNIDDTQVFQEIDGFGGAMTASSAWLLKNTLGDDERQRVMEQLFDTEKGIGISYVRICMGASDFRLKEYTYDDVPAGQDDLKLEKFSVAADEEYIIPILLQAGAINPHLKIMASP